VAGWTLSATVWVEATVGSVAIGDDGGDAADTQNTAVHYCVLTLFLLMWRIGWDGRWALTRHLKGWDIFFIRPVPSLSLSLFSYEIIRVLVKICYMPAPYNDVNHTCCQYTNFAPEYGIRCPMLQIVSLLCYFVWPYEVNLTGKRIWISR
jgi:hypothetical protein